MSEATIVYRAYLLRLWCSPGAGWRVSLEDPGTGRRRAFASLALCMDFLEQLGRRYGYAESPDGFNGGEQPGGMDLAGPSRDASI